MSMVMTYREEKEALICFFVSTVHFVEGLY